jgi:methylmalonyl-CoA mutase
MTDDVTGGLDEPDQLQPEQGALELASPEDDWSRVDWEKIAAAVLRRSGRLSDDDPDTAVWDALTRTTYDGLQVPPLGTPDLADGLVTSGRPTRVGDWDVRTLNHGDHETALEDLERGVTSLWLDTDDVAGALEGVLLDLAPVVLEHGTPGRARTLLALAGGKKLPSETNLGADPIAARVTGRTDSGDDDAVEVARLALEHGVRGLVVDATALHDLGASDAQEVGYSLAAGAAYLRLLTDAGLSVDEAAGLVEFRYAATDEQLPTIAKLRAARRCWGRVLELSGADRAAGAQVQHAVTSRPMLSVYDPWVNMLRGTVAAFAAGVGGAESVTVVPFDSPLGEPDAFGRRIARNVSSLLLAESHVGAVTDPAGGAFAVERLTDDLAVAAWSELQRIGSSGGIVAALEDGSLLGRVAEVVARRARDVATRTKPITGLSEYPNLFETLPPRQGEGDQVGRYGAAFEALRRVVLDEPVYLATMGTRPDHTARATLMTNLFAAGGIHVEGGSPASDVQTMVDENDGQPVVCLVGTDSAYAGWGADAADAMRRCGAEHVIVAGAPQPWADDSFRPGEDAVEFLTRTREALR